MSEDCAEESFEESAEEGEVSYEQICQEHDVPIEGAVSQANTSVEIVELDTEPDLEEMVDIDPDTYKEKTTNKEHAVLENRIKKYISQKERDPTTSKEKIAALYSLLKDIPKNATGLTIGKYLVDRENTSIDDLVLGDNVLVVLHGYMQNEGAYLNFVKQVKAKGHKVIALGWNFRDFNSGGKKATDLAKSIYQKTGTKATFLGHSDGAKALTYGALNHGLDQYAEKFVFMEADVNHMRNSLPGHYLIGGIPKSGNLDTKEGKEGALLQNSQLFECPTYSIYGTGFGDNDGLVNLEAAAMMRESGAIDIPTTHFGMAGTNKNVNRAVIEYAAESEWSRKSTEWDTLGRYIDKHTPDKKGDTSSVANFTKKNRGNITPHGAWYN